MDNILFINLTILPHSFLRIPRFSRGHKKLKCSRTKKLKKVYLDKKVYSEDGLMTNEQIFDYVDQIMYNAFKDIEIPDIVRCIKRCVILSILIDRKV